MNELSLKGTSYFKSPTTQKPNIVRQLIQAMTKKSLVEKASANMGMSLGVQKQIESANPKDLIDTLRTSPEDKAKLFENLAAKALRSSHVKRDELLTAFLQKIQTDKTLVKEFHKTVITQTSYSMKPTIEGLFETFLPNNPLLSDRRLSRAAAAEEPAPPSTPEKRPPIEALDTSIKLKEAELKALYRGYEKTFSKEFIQWALDEFCKEANNFIEASQLLSRLEKQENSAIAPAVSSPVAAPDHEKDAENRMDLMPAPRKTAAEETKPTMAQLRRTSVKNGHRVNPEFSVTKSNDFKREISDCDGTIQLSSAITDQTGRVHTLCYTFKQPKKAFQFGDALKNATAAFLPLLEGNRLYPPSDHVFKFNAIGGNSITIHVEPGTVSSPNPETGLAN